LITASLEQVACVGAAFIIIHNHYKNKKYRTKRRWWVRQLLQRRKSYERFILDLHESDLFNNFTIISSADFEFLIHLIGPKVSKENTNFRDSISVAVRLGITLRFLSSGESYHCLMYTFKVAKRSISEIVPEVCEALISVKYLLKITSK